jgi:hypothetical protein
MGALRSKPGLLVGLGIAMVLAGFAASIRPINDVAQEAQGHCDYLRCVTSTTLPLLAVALAVVVVGAFVLFLGARRIRQS